MTLDLDKIEQLAIAARDVMRGSAPGEMVTEQLELAAALQPGVVLALVERLRAAEAKIEAMREDAWQAAAERDLDD